VGTGTDGDVVALAVSGTDLYAGGSFTAAGGVAARNIARWNGSTWSALGTGMDPWPVRALAVSGSDLYAGGDFTTAGGVSANRVAKWDGTTWSPLGTGMSGGSFTGVKALAVSGNDLYAGGDFTWAGGVTVNSMARWDGATWSALGSGMNRPGWGLYPDNYALAASGDALFAGGSFWWAGGKISSEFAVWQPRVNVSTLLLAGNPGDATLGDDVYGFYKPALITDAGTTVSYAGGLPVNVTMERAPEIHVNGNRVNGAFMLTPEGVAFGGTGATLRVEFSEDDAAGYGVDPGEFGVFLLIYRSDYPLNKEATVFRMSDGGTPFPIRIENGRQIYAVEVPISRIASTYGAIPKSLAAQTGVEVWESYE